MKYAIHTLAMLLVLAVFTSGAYATHPDELVCTADCAGWSYTGHFYFGTAAYVNVDYTVTLLSGTTTVYTFTGNDVLYPSGPTFDYNGIWDMELCGDYTVNMHLHFASNEGWGNRYYTTSFTCDCDEPGGCTYTPGYWKNHPEAWPVSSLTLGGVTYSMAQLMVILDAPVRGDATVILAHHLIAAKLNVLNGADDGINGYIDGADAFLMIYPLFSRPKGEAKEEGEEIKDALCAYNELPCEEDSDDVMVTGDVGAALNSAAEEPASWGSLKKLHEE